MLGLLINLEIQHRAGMDESLSSPIVLIQPNHLGLSLFRLLAHSWGSYLDMRLRLSHHSWLTKPVLYDGLNSSSHLRDRCLI